MYSTRGRPRTVTDEQIEAILEWHRNRKPMRVFAREIGLSEETIRQVIKRNGQYKQPSPEKRELVLSERRRKFKRMRQDGWL